MIELTQMQSGKLIAKAMLTLSEMNGSSPITTAVVEGITEEQLRDGIIASDCTKMPPETHIRVELIEVKDRGSDGLVITVRLHR